jgi:predicted RNase H-like nuclease
VIAGVDGTSKGWVAVVCGDQLDDPRSMFMERLIDLPRELRIAAVDVPIGLPDRGGRDADRLAREALGEPRRRSVFPCPVRPALAAASWEEACALTERADGRRVSKQTFAILEKVAEADAFVRSDPWAQRVVHEVHPELSFARWSGAVMVYRKKSAAGREKRRRVIAETFGPSAFETLRASLRGCRVGSDDLADAFAAAWSASRILTRSAERLPEDKIVDAEGVSMAIWA